MLLTIFLNKSYLPDLHLSNEGHLASSRISNKYKKSIYKLKLRINLIESIL